jgi:hypothetical protein
MCHGSTDHSQDMVMHIDEPKTKDEMTNAKTRVFAVKQQCFANEDADPHR